MHTKTFLLQPPGLLIFDQKMKNEADQNTDVSRLISKRRIISVVCSILQTSCGSPQQKGINCECVLLCRKNMVCLHFSSPCLFQPPSPCSLTFSYFSDPRLLRPPSIPELRVLKHIILLYYYKLQKKCLVKTFTCHNDNLENRHEELMGEREKKMYSPHHDITL